MRADVQLLSRWERRVWAPLELTNAEVSFLSAFVYTSQEETKDSSSFVSKFDIKFRDDCVSCKYISAAVCYGCGVIVLQTVKSIPASNLPAKVMTGIFGAGTLNLPGDNNKIPSCKYCLHL